MLAWPFAAPPAHLFNALSMTRTPTRTDKDQPLIEDIRVLGRILGDVIREQEV